MELIASVSLDEGKVFRIEGFLRKDNMGGRGIRGKNRSYPGRICIIKDMKRISSGGAE